MAATVAVKAAVVPLVSSRKFSEGRASVWRGTSFQLPKESSRSAKAQTTQRFPARRSCPRASWAASISRVAKAPSLLRVMASMGLLMEWERCSARPADSPQPILLREKIFAKESPRRRTSARGSGRQSPEPRVTCSRCAVSWKRAEVAGSVPSMGTRSPWCVSLSGTVGEGSGGVFGAMCLAMADAASCMA